MQTIIDKRNLKKAMVQVSNRNHITHFIGNTPLLELKNISRQVTPVKIYAKAEWSNPGGSIKDRAALNMIRHAIKDGQLTAEKSILDATSGNTGIAYAMIGASLGYRVILCLPQNAGNIHKQIIRSFGAEIIFTDPMYGTDGAIKKARELTKEYPDKYFYVDQYNNDNNWRAHYDGTGPEIIRQTHGDITHFVAGLGSSGTFVGTGRWLKKVNSEIKLISFQPDSPLHGMEGMKHMETAMVPGIYDPLLADKNLEVITEDAQEMVKLLAKKEGLLVGNSAGGALAAALQVAGELSRGIVVTVFPDSAYKYMGQSFWGDSNEAH